MSSNDLFHQHILLLCISSLIRKKVDIGALHYWFIDVEASDQYSGQGSEGITSSWQGWNNSKYTSHTAVPFLDLNALRQRQNGRHFADDILKCIFMNENVWILIKISLKFVPKGPINNIPPLVQMMAWRRAGDKPLYEPMMVSLPTLICVTRPQWVNTFLCNTCACLGVHRWVNMHHKNLWIRDSENQEFPLKCYSLTHWGQDKMAAIFQTTLLFEFLWSLFLGVQLTIFQHWFG